MRISRFIVAVAVSCAATGGMAGASLKLATIDGPPWGFVGTDGKPTGMMYEISNRIAQEAGFTWTNQLVPYARIGPEIASGKADFVLRFSSEEMVSAAIPAAVVVTMPVIAVGGKGVRFRTVEDLRGKLVGVVRKSRYTEAFDNDSQIRKYEADNYLQVVRMLKMKRLDAGVGASAGLYYSAHMAGLKSEELGVPLVIGSNDFILHFSKATANQETIDALNQAVKRLNQRGEIRKIINSYIGEYRFEFADAR